MHADNPELNSSLGKLYGQYIGKLDSSAFYLEKAAILAPENSAVYIDLGIVYGLQKNYSKALESFQRALKLDPNDPQIQQNISITYDLINQSKSK
jgi:Flp pilus assembly protein TadD